MASVANASDSESTLFPNTPGFRSGQVIAGRYAIQRVIGSGGMATIVEAIHLELGSRVAIKVLHTATTTNEAIDRFLREARAIFPLRSENVCRVLDLGRLPDGAPFIVMEFLEGTDFANAFRATQVPPARAAAYVVQACKGLAEAHALGIVHRDIKPANLFLTKRSDGAELVKVLDFGISKLRREGDESLTAEGQILGTPRYMAPEQFGGAMEADARADVWAIGLVLYKLIAGRLPYTAITVADIYAELMNRAPEDIRRAVPGIDPALGAVVMRCIERDANKRFASARELGAALEAHAHHAGTEVLPATPPAAPAAPVPPEAPTTIADPAPSERSWRVLAIAAIAVALLLLGAGVYAFARSSPQPVEAGTTMTITTTTTSSPVVSTPTTPPIASSVTSSAPVVVAPPTTTRIPGPRKPDCSVPYYYDANHIKVFRPECVH